MPNVYDALGSTLTWGTSSTFDLEKVSITLPSIDNGEPIDITHLENTAWRTSVPKTLKSVGPITFEGHLKTDKYVSAPYGSVETITFTDPNGDTVAFVGSLQTLEPGEAVEGEKITVTGTIAVHNTSDSGATETGPVFTDTP